MQQKTNTQEAAAEPTNAVEIRQPNGSDDSECARMVAQMIELCRRRRLARQHPRERDTDASATGHDSDIVLGVEAGCIALSIHTLYGEAAWMLPMIAIDNCPPPGWPRIEGELAERDTEGRRVDPLVYIPREHDFGIAVPSSEAAAWREKLRRPVKPARRKKQRAA